MACVGKGTYTTFFPDQGGGASAIRSTYSGQWKDGRRHGSGEELAPDGSGYSGAWKNGKMHGKGAMHGIADRFVVKGKWERGEPNKLTRAALLSITPQPPDDVDRDAEAILGATTMTVGGGDGNSIHHPVANGKARIKSKPKPAEATATATTATAAAAAAAATARTATRTNPKRAPNEYGRHLGNGSIPQ